MKRLIIRQKLSSGLINEEHLLSIAIHYSLKVHNQGNNKCGKILQFALSNRKSGSQNTEREDTLYLDRIVGTRNELYLFQQN